jgi:hypothetical protein
VKIVKRTTMNCLTPVTPTICRNPQHGVRGRCWALHRDFDHLIRKHRAQK